MWCLCVFPQIQSLQEQLENGPTAQLARLQQENSILRDALNQATSQAESRYYTQSLYNPHSVNNEVSKFWVNSFLPSKDMNTYTNGDNVVYYKLTYLNVMSFISWKVTLKV